MILKIQSIRFSKDYFSNFEECAKWLDIKTIPIITQQELDNFFVFEQVSKEKLLEVSLQEYKLDAGVMAMIGISNGITAPTMENILDSEPVQLVDENTKLKDTISKFADDLTKLVQGITGTVNVEKKKVVKPNSDENNFEFYVPIYKAEEKADEKIAIGPVLIPMSDDDEVDGQNQTYDAKAVEDAAHYWMESWQQMTEMHTNELDEKQFSILESYIAPVDFELNGHTVIKGTWILMIRVLDDDLWQKIKDGELNAFSIGGVATAEEMEDSDG